MKASPVTAGVTRRARVLAHLQAHPGLTAWELGRALGLASGALTDLLRDMRRKGQVVTALERRPQQGRDVSLWYAAPPGTAPPDPAGDELRRKRRRAREAQRRRRARARAQAASRAVTVPLLDGAACRGTDLGLFFGAAHEEPEERQAREAKALAICAGCPVRRQCYDLAHANGEPWGIWGGVDFAAKDGTKGQKAS